MSNPNQQNDYSFRWKLQPIRVLLRSRRLRMWRYSIRQTVPRLLWEFYLLLRRFLLELRSLPYRMALLCKRPRYLYGIVFPGPYLQVSPEGHLEPCTRIHAYRQDIKRFLTSRRWATVIDWEVYQEGWVSGAAWGVRNPCSYSEASIERSFISPSKLTEEVRR